MRGIGEDEGGDVGRERGEGAGRRRRWRREVGEWEKRVLFGGRREGGEWVFRLRRRQKGRLGGRSRGGIHRKEWLVEDPATGRGRDEEEDGEEGNVRRHFDGKKKNLFSFNLEWKDLGLNE